jgi:hypothetical protein
MGGPLCAPTSLIGYTSPRSASQSLYCVTIKILSASSDSAQDPHKSWHPFPGLYIWDIFETIEKAGK